ncbi:hypothetical protein, partial [Raoultella ornithinolytica]|uniref:hypothetical protein n=1 Tax=Raoultella ornithinolytica TaxID=54291 RepID=UPI0015E2A6CC
ATDNTGYVTAQAAVNERLQQLAWSRGVFALNEHTSCHFHARCHYCARRTQDAASFINAVQLICSAGQSVHKNSLRTRYAECLAQSDILISQPLIFFNLSNKVDQ